MFETQQEALDAIGSESERVEYCDTCEAWTIVDEGYPICMCA